MSTLSSTGILLSLTTVSVTLDFSLHGGLMAWSLSSNLTLNQSLPTSDTLNTSEKDEVSRMSLREKNWPALLILVVILLTIGGNILVIMAVSLEKKLQNATNFFLMSLAVADMLVGILVMPVSLITVLYGFFRATENVAAYDDSLLETELGTYTTLACTDGKLMASGQVRVKG